MREKGVDLRLCKLVINKKEISIKVGPVTLGIRLVPDHL